ncbi:jg18804 [Pararge aegeria aegeria]|uniref:Jg18804 protein n=1 Tax=Pararge aegeria aegeria TaxID=348720 RepID=A0A8S4S821_9NEOP|nr:jg18804 [Pararge aegeria aegeria]
MYACNGCSVLGRYRRLANKKSFFKFVDDMLCLLHITGKKGKKNKKKQPADGSTDGQTDRQMDKQMHSEGFVTDRVGKLFYTQLAVARDFVCF